MLIEINEDMADEVVLATLTKQLERSSFAVATYVERYGRGLEAPEYEKEEFTLDLALKEALAVVLRHYKP